MLDLLGKAAARKDFARALEHQLVARARAPYFFAGLGVPDTVDGRFDMVVLHGWLALARLQAAGMNEAAQALTDALFISFDEALREQGTGDMGMGRRMKAMAEAFHGRLTAYSMAQDDEQLAAALARNVWRGQRVDDRVRRLAAYVQQARLALAAAPIAEGVLDFGPIPGDAP